jgi:hypothetical protein
VGLVVSGRRFGIAKKTVVLIAILFGSKVKLAEEESLDIHLADRTGAQ